MPVMDEPADPPPESAVETIACGMCKQRVPVEQTRNRSGRPLCLGCLAAWYGEDDEDDEC